MIEYAAYLPTPTLEDLQPLMDFAFLEPCTQQDYVGFYKAHSGFKLLDNGFIENSYPLDLDSLMRFSTEIGAHVIVAPDHLGDWQFNFKNAKKLYGLIGAQRTACVLAGRRYDQFEEQLQEVASIAHTVMLPYRLNRTMLSPLNLMTRLHLLGLKTPEDFSVYKHAPEHCKVSLDTSEPISAAYHYWTYEERGFASFRRPFRYHDLELKHTQLEIAKSNITWMKRQLHTNAQSWR